MFGKKTTEYGIRFGSKDTWGYSSKSEAQSAARRMNKNAKGGTQAKVIQRTKKLTILGNEKDKCSGGKCKPSGQVCRKHARKISGSDFELYDKQGRNKNTKRWDE